MASLSTAFCAALLDVYPCCHACCAVEELDPKAMSAAQSSR